jgi:hypothetical protein
MTIEKAFAIKASREAIYALLEGDLASAEAYAGKTHAVLSRRPPESLELRVTLGIVPCRLMYRLLERDGQTEVVATVEPYGWRYAIFQLATLGLRRSFFEFALVDALANLKSAVESQSPAPPAHSDS